LGGGRSHWRASFGGNLGHLTGWGVDLGPRFGLSPGLDSVQVEIIKEVSGSHWWLRGHQKGLCLCHGAYLHEHIVMLMLLAIAAIGVPL
jgi:hypothetical protein